MLNNYYCKSTQENLDLLIKKGYNADNLIDLLKLINDKEVDYLFINKNKIEYFNKNNIDESSLKIIPENIMESDDFISYELKNKIDMERYKNSTKEELINEILKLKDGIKSIRECHREIVRDMNYSFSKKYRNKA